jgi:hypothetical protein
MGGGDESACSYAKLRFCRNLTLTNIFRQQPSAELSWYRILTRMLQMPMPSGESPEPALRSEYNLLSNQKVDFHCLSSQQLAYYVFKCRHDFIFV